MYQCLLLEVVLVEVETFTFRVDNPLVVKVETWPLLVAKQPRKVVVSVSSQVPYLQIRAAWIMDGHCASFFSFNKNGPCPSMMGIS